MAFDILTINQGCSSLKFAVFEAADHPEGVKLKLGGEINHLDSNPEFSVTDEQHELITHQLWSADEIGHEAAFRKLLLWLRQNLGHGHLQAVGHRVVHGGDSFTAPVLVDENVLSALERFVPLAPLHQPHNLSAIRVLRSLEPELPQVACFDTAFHSTIPKLARRFALPAAYETEGIRRYGFHGLSYEYIAREMRRTAPATIRGRVVVAHLGSGDTLCAMRNGESVDTTTGLTALDGLPMSTRCGAIDPGVVLYLLRHHRFGIDNLEHLLYYESGLLGLSGLSGSMQTLLESEDSRAKEAIDFFVFRVAREIGALISTLEGLDGLVFTAGIGEHAAPVRSAICANLGWLGVRLDAASNARGASVISTPESLVEVRVIATNEERMIGRCRYSSGL